MIELQGTLIERLEQALPLVCADVTDQQVAHFRDMYAQAGIKPSAAATAFFMKYGGAYRDSYIMLPDPKYNAALFFRCYGNDETTDNLDYAQEYADIVRSAAQQDVCPVALIGFDIPAEVYVGENGTLYCLYEFKEEVDAFESPAQILEYYLRNHVPIGVDKKPIRTLMTNALIDVLCGKDANAAYALLQQLEEQSASDAGLYPLLGDFLNMLQSDNSLVRARGFRLAVAQARWDSDNVIDARIGELLSVLHDPKGTTTRQCLQFADVLLDAKPYLFPQVESSLESMDLTRYPDGIRPLIAKDANELAAHVRVIAGGVEH